MKHVYNFSAGPAMLPPSVMQQAQAEFIDWHDSGASIMEISHRSASFKELLEDTKDTARELLNIPSHYDILFLPGGGRSQFSMVPMNLLGQHTQAAYVNCGVWGQLAINEAMRYCDVSIIADNNHVGPKGIPPQSTWLPYDECAYVYTVDNETVQGMEFDFTPDTGDIPLVSDMSSNLLSRTIDVNRFGLIFACAQKNIGPAGITIVIVRKDLLEIAPLPFMPTMYHYATHAKAKSLYNTTPTYPCYMVNLVLHWIKAQGGVTEIEHRNRLKANKLYDYIDHEDFYYNDVEKNSRSRMNVVFDLHEHDLTAQFCKEADERGLIGLRGHSSRGGLRASIYNAMPIAGVEALIDFMRYFARQYG